VHNHGERALVDPSGMAEVTVGIADEWLGCRLGHQGRRSRYLLRAGMAWMTNSSPPSKTRTTVSSSRALVSKPQAQLPVGRAALLERVDPQRPLCRLDRILR